MVRNALSWESYCHFLSLPRATTIRLVRISRPSDWAYSGTGLFIDRVPIHTRMAEMLRVEASRKSALVYEPHFGPAAARGPPTESTRSAPEPPSRKIRQAL